MARGSTGNVIAALASFFVPGLGQLLEVQVMGSSLPPRHVVRDGLLFLLVAAHVYAVMVVQPKMRYYREKIASFDTAAEDDPWRLKFQAQHRRSARVNVIGLVLAVA